MDCQICRGPDGDPELHRTQVWENDLWRLTTNVEGGYTVGFSYLEPKRHVPHVEDLDGAEAATFGTVLAHCARVLKEEAEAERVYVYVFGGGIPHLHVHLAPHREGDPLNDEFIRGSVRMETLPSGAQSIVSDTFDPLPDEDLRKVADRVRRRLATDPPSAPPSPLPWLPHPSPPSRPFHPGDPEIPPLRPDPDPDEPWPDRPAHDPWF